MLLLRSCWATVRELFSELIDGSIDKTIEEIAPEYAIVNSEIKARRTVAQALTKGVWIDYIKNPITINLFMQVLAIWEECHAVQLHPLIEDDWRWTWDSKGVFTTKSVYHAHFKTKITCDVAEAIWKSWAPMKCKLPMWLIIRGRVWTADRLARRGLPRNDKCPFCNVADEDVQHLFVGCAVVNIIWGHLLPWCNLHQLTPPSQANLQKWWLQARSNVNGKLMRRLDSLVILVVWMIWRERNNRIFEKIAKTTTALIEIIKQEAKQWVIACAGRFTLE